MINFLKIAKKKLKHSHLNRLSRFLFKLIPVLYRERLAQNTSYAFSSLELKHDFAFIHIPKCAGNAVINSLFSCRSTGHVPVSKYYKEDKGQLDRCFLFTVCRNPYDRFESAFYYLKKGGMGLYDKEFSDKYLTKHIDINDFVIRLGSDRKFKRKIISWTHFIPQHVYICLNDEVYVTNIYKQEELEEHFIEISKGIGVEKSSKPLMKKNVTKGKGNNVPLNNKSKKIIYEIYARDFELLGYEA